MQQRQKFPVCKTITFTSSQVLTTVVVLVSAVIPDLQDPNKGVEYKRFILSEYVKVYPRYFLATLISLMTNLDFEYPANRRAGS